MSKVYFHFLTPVILTIVTIMLLKFAPPANQELIVGYNAVIYAIVVAWRILVDRSSSLSPSTSLKKLPDGGEIPHALQELAFREYEYIRETMAQAMNDRHTMVNYFLLATGVVLAAIGAIYSQEGMSYSPYKNQMTIAICLAFNLISWVYLMMLIRLRQAWCESAAAMDRIKQFVLINHGYSDEEAYSPFRWRRANIPAAAKKGTLYHFAAILISVVSSSGLAVASLMLLGAEGVQTWISIPIGWFLFNFFLQNSTYSIFLKENNNRSANNSHSAKSSGGHSETVKNQGTVKANSAVVIQSQVVAKPQHSRTVILRERETVYDGFFKVERAVLQFEKFDGTLSKEVQRLNFERGHSTGILLYDEAAREFVLTEQFRYPPYADNPANGWLTEVIAGMVDPGEMPLQAAIREVLEETGYEVREAEALVEFYVSPGGSSERISVFWGKLGQQPNAGGGKAGEQEDIRMVRMSVAEAYQKLEERFFKDAKTIIALQAVRQRVMLETR